MCVKVMCVKDLRGHAHGNVVCVCVEHLKRCKTST